MMAASITRDGMFSITGIMNFTVSSNHTLTDTHSKTQATVRLEP